MRSDLLTQVGFLFAAGQVQDLATQLDYVVSNFYLPSVQAKAEKLNIATKDNFSLEKMVTTYDDWYNKLLQKI